MNKQNQVSEILVGLFIIAAAVALLALAFKVSGLTMYKGNGYYVVYANFDNIGGLKVRAPVRVAGVRIGEVSQIQLDPATFLAKVTLLVDKKVNDIPEDSSATILTEGILGCNYVGITPGYDDKVLKNGGVIVNTHPALILENLIGQLIFSIKGGNEDKK